MNALLTVPERPTRGRWRRIVVGLLVVALVMGLAVSWFGLTHRRDESAFVAYLRAYPGEVSVEEGGDVDAAIATSHQFTTEPAAMIAAGYRACAWLGAQPFRGVLLQDRDADQPGLVAEYLKTPGSHELGWSAYPLDSSVVAAAWAHLCPGAYALHRRYSPLTTSD